MSLDGPIGLGLLRGAHLAALLVLFGTLAFRWIVAPRLTDARLDGGLRRTALIAAAAALLIGGAWFLAEVASVTGASTVGGVFAATPTVLVFLGFARLLLARLALLLLALAVLIHAGPHGLRGRRLAVGFGLGAAALGMEPWLSHAGAAGGIAGDVLPAAELLHLAGAGAWFGGLPALMLALVALPGDAAAPLVRRFSMLGLAAVIAIAFGGAIQGWLLVGGAAGRWVGTGYGLSVLGKTVLFGMALMFALINRVVLSPQLAEPTMRVACRRLRLSVGAEAMLGLATVLLAGLLSELPPGIERTAAPATFGWPGLVLPAGAGVIVVAAAAALWLGRGRFSSSLKHEVPS